MCLFWETISCKMLMEHLTVSRAETLSSYKEYFVSPDSCLFINILVYMYCRTGSVICFQKWPGGHIIYHKEPKTFIYWTGLRSVHNCLWNTYQVISTLQILFNLYSNLYNNPHNTPSTTVLFGFGKPSMHRVMLIIVII